MNFSGKISNILDRFQPSETTVLIGTAIVVGVGTGFGAVGFIEMIGFIQRLFFNGGEQAFPFLGPALIIIIPTLGGLLAGPIISFFASEAKGHGVPEVMQAIALRGGRIRPRVVVAKILASSLCIGSGGSAGREGPIVQVGAALGSSLGQWLRMSDNRIRNLVACGAAAGIAATFNAPIAGVIFAMEIILGELHLGDLGNVVISAITASTIARIFLGDQPAFAITADYGMQAPWEIFLYVLLGVLAAFAAVGFTKMLYWFEDLFDGWKFPDALKPAVGGLLLGLLAFFYPLVLGLGFVPSQERFLGLPLSQNLPQVFGSGFPVIENALIGNLPIGLLFVLIFLKPLATSLTLGSGNSGGVFAPGLFTGAVLGGALGKLLAIILPGASIDSGAFAIAGMAAVFAGAARAPFTAILIVFEMTDDYRMIVPLMASVVTTLVVAEQLMRDSIYTLKLTRRGIRIQRGRDVDVMESVLVDEVMVKEPVIVSTGMPVTVLAEKFIETGRHGFPVLDEKGHLYGVVSLEDYRNAISNGRAQDNLNVGEIATRDIITVYPDETVGVALRRMAPRDISRLPVVSREDPLQLLGMVRRNDIVRAYEVGVTRHEDGRLRRSKFRIQEASGFETLEIRIEHGAVSDGKALSEIHWPREVVVVSIQRGRKSMIPRGNLILKAGDEIVLLSERNVANEVRKLCLASENKNTQG